MSNPKYHHYTRPRRRHPSSPPFRTFLSLFPHNVARKNSLFIRTDTQLSTLYCTKPTAMGGSAIRNGPATTALLEHYPAAYQIFEQAGWLHYFRRLQGYNEPQALQFAHNLQDNHFVVAGVRISVTEQDISAVSGLPMDGTRQFSRKHIIGDVQQSFFLAGERIVLKGRGVQLSSLPPPWPEVARFIKHYLTYEGCYQVVYQHDFLLLSHLRHNRRVNIPYFLLGCLKNMAHYCRREKDPTQSLTHHRLVQLLINRGFEQQNHPPLNLAPAAEVPAILDEQQQQNPPISLEKPHSPPTQPTSPPTIPESSHTAPESSTSALHIIIDDSEPENISCPIIEEKPPRKRPQIAPFPPFLRKKRIKASMRPPWMTTTLDPPPIRLKLRKPLISPTPDPLPTLTMGAATQEPNAPETVTPSVSQKVAETQEPVTHSVAETQEPAMVETQETATAETQEPAADSEIELQELETQTSFVFEVAETKTTTHPAAETQEPTTGITVESKEIETPEAATQHPVAETQEPATNFGSKETEAMATATQHSEAETQQPATDIDIEIQELEVEGAETLLSLHQEAETQVSEAIPVAAPQEPTKETMTVTQEPVIPKSKPTMTDVLQENEFLKSQLETYQQELARAREEYEKELTRYTLERTTTLAAQTTESICKEYMCCQCGNIYYQAGYKIVQVPVPGAAPTPSPFEVKPAVTQEPTGSIKLKTKPAVTQEPAGLRKSKTEPAVTQEPAGSSRIKKEAPTVVNKAMQTLPMEEVTPPSQGTLSTSREQSTQTLPGPTTANAQTQTSHRWDEYAEIQRWKKEYVEIQAQQLQVHRQTWRNHTFLIWEALDLTRQEIREVKKKRELKDRMVKVFDMMQQLMATRKTSCNYSLFLMERLTWFQIRSIIEGKPHEVISSIDFIQTFEAASTRDQHFLCEAYFHNEAILENRTLNINPLVGDVQLRAFTSFLLNQITWQGDFSAAKNNEDNRSLWIRPEPQRAAIFIAQYHAFLKKKGMIEHVQQLESEVIQDCERIISAIQIPALQANNLFWQQSTKQRQHHNPFGPVNLEAAISRIPSYIQCVRHCAENWIGYKFYFPLLWLPIETYQVSYKLSKKAETTAWHILQEEQGFKTPTDSTARSYCLSTLHG
jgi:hypothetical protein